MQNTFKQGDIVLIPYPYTDLTAVKKRPVVIVSKDKINGEAFIVAKITSVISGGALSFSLLDSELILPLPKPSEVRTAQVFTAHKSLIIKKISRLQAATMERLAAQIQANFETT